LCRALSRQIELAAALTNLKRLFIAGTFDFQIFTTAHLILT
jgi:hypothetical protein